MTQHVLFVGFSMRDENWCRIVEIVRNSLGPFGTAPRAAASDEPNQSEPNQSAPNQSEPTALDAALGTMLPLESDSLFDSLWTSGERPLLRVAAMGDLLQDLSAESIADGRPTAEGEEGSMGPSLTGVN